MMIGNPAIAPANAGELQLSGDSEWALLFSLLEILPNDP